MQRPSSNSSMPLVVSWFLIALGSCLSAIAVQLLPDPSSSPSDAPDWVLFITGLVFIVSGILSMLKKDSAVQHLVAALFLALMGALGLWAALAPAETMSGGIPFMPDALNVFLGRMVFGSGAVISFSMCLYAVKLFVKSYR